MTGEVLQAALSAVLEAVRRVHGRLPTLPPNVPDQARAAIDAAAAAVARLQQ